MSLETKSVGVQLCKKLDKFSLFFFFFGLEQNKKKSLKFIVIEKGENTNTQQNVKKKKKCIYLYPLLLFTLHVYSTRNKLAK